MAQTNSDNVINALAASCALINLRTSYWTGQCRDSKVAKDVTYQNGAAAGSAKVTKYLVARKPIDDILKYRSRARNLIESRTAPWAATGARIVSVKKLPQLMLDVGALKNKFDEKVADFVRDYPNLIQRAEQELGMLFDADRYPSTASMAERFSMSVVVSAVPSMGDFRFELPPEIKSELDRNFNAAVVSAAGELSEDLVSRCSKVVEALATKLADPDAKRFSDSTFNKIRETADLVESLNVTGSADVSEAVAALRSLQGVDKAGVKEDSDYRAQCAERAKAVADLSVFDMM